MIAPAAWARLKAGVIAAISMCGGVDGAEATVGRDRSTTGNWRNPNHQAMPRIDLAFLLDQVAVLQGKRPPVLDAYAAELGYVATPLPDGGQCADVLATFVAATAEFGDICTAIHTAKSDGEICPKDETAICREIDDMQAALARLRLTVCGGR